MKQKPNESKRSKNPRPRGPKSKPNCAEPGRGLAHCKVMSCQYTRCISWGCSTESVPPGPSQSPSTSFSLTCRIASATGVAFTISCVRLYKLRTIGLFLSQRTYALWTEVSEQRWTMMNQNAKWQLPMCLGRETILLPQRSFSMAEFADKVEP